MNLIKGSEQAYNYDHEMVIGTFWCPHHDPGDTIMITFKKWPKDGIWYFAWKVGQKLTCERMVAERLQENQMFTYEREEK